ncbi:MAG: hypothetical protein A2987_06105 [Omnitrophica bacterium RIFCSPLOWO2_01_FULL_45_10]|nr:MAG: hypothetical protein A2987_06105 [Omnitrophica bacterium RIFCSPLOWO2_01_FULL_45_10]
MNKRAGTLVEIIIANVLIAVTLTGLLGMYNFSRAVFIESRQTLVAINCLDSIMAYFESCMVDDPPPDAPYPVSPETILFSNYADNSVTPPIQITPFAINLFERDKMTTILKNNLKRCLITYTVEEHLGTASSYRDRLVRLRIEWDGLRKNALGAPVRRSERLFSIFTSSGW